MTKFTKRDIEGYNRVMAALAEGKAYGDTMQEGTTEIVNGLSITVGTSTTQTNWDMEKITAKYPSITKEKYGKKTPRKASVKVSIITK